MRNIKLAATFCLLMLTASLSLAWPPGGNGGGGGGNGNGGGGGEEPPPEPPVLEYEYISLGSFGGSTGGARALNDAGEVVGWSDLADGARHAFFFTDRFTSPGDFVLWDLNDLIDEPGCVLTTAHGLNNAGQIVGDADCNGNLRGFIYSPPAVLNEGTPEETVIPYSLVILDSEGSIETYADDINDLGDVVAEYVLPDGAVEFVVRTSEGITIQTGVYRDYVSLPAAIDLTGSFASYAPSPDPLIGNQAFVFDLPNLTAFPLPLLGTPAPDYSNYSEANDINAFGEVTGQSTVGLVPTGKKGKNAYEFGGTHAFRFSPLVGIQDLGDFDGQDTFGEAINGSGDVVGRIVMGFRQFHIFIYTDSDLDGDGASEGMIDITSGILNYPAELADNTFEIEGMNNSGVICGWSGVAGPFVLVPVAP